MILRAYGELGAGVASYVVGDGGVFYTIDVFGAGFGGENAENSGSAADVEHGFPIEEGC